MREPRGGRTVRHWSLSTNWLSVSPFAEGLWGGGTDGDGPATSLEWIGHGLTEPIPLSTGKLAYLQ